MDTSVHVTWAHECFLVDVVVVVLIVVVIFPVVSGTHLYSSGTLLQIFQKETVHQGYQSILVIPQYHQVRADRFEAVLQMMACSIRLLIITSC